METPSSPLIAVVLVAMVTACLYPGVSAAIGSGGSTPPTGLPPTLVPGQPFSVVWNHPADRCLRYHGPYNFTDYGILENSNHQFIGDRVAVFYNLGDWPAIHGPSSNWRNGGLPQLANITRHLEMARRHIEERIPDPDFDGLGVIDMESWRPLFSFNWDSFRIYQEQSIDRVRTLHPDWRDDRRVEVEAAREFETAARELLQQTLQLAKEMRRKGRWGYYILPDCYSNRQGDCPDWAVEGNDRLQWLYNMSTAIYPSPYLYGSRGQRGRRFMQANVQEGFRVIQATPTRDAPVVPYVWMNMDPVDPEEVELSLRMPAEMGVAGVVVWGSSGAYKHPQACQQLHDFLYQHLGPWASQLLQPSRMCSQQLCSGNGRCTHKCFLEPPVGRVCADFDLSQTAFSQPFNVNYGCRCYPGWTGQNCSLPA